MVGMTENEPMYHDSVLCQENTMLTSTVILARFFHVIVITNEPIRRISEVKHSTYCILSCGSAGTGL